MNSENQIWGPNLELVTGSFFTGKSKAGSALGGRGRGFFRHQNEGTLFILVNFCYVIVHRIKKSECHGHEQMMFNGGFFDLSCLLCFS